MRLSRALFFLLTGGIIAQDNDTASPVFFLSLIPSKCQYGGSSLLGDDNFVKSGSLCAYAREADIVYACVAGDNACWNVGGRCRGRNASEPGANQVACSNIGIGNVHWCCNSQFGRCTGTKYQQNNCWSKFNNPIRNVNPLNAASSASAAKQIGLTQPTLTNIIVSTLARGGWVTEATSTTSSSGQTSSLPTSSAAATATPASGSSISRGAIAGIVIGVIAIITVTISIGFIIRHKRRRRTEVYRQTQQPAELPPKEAAPVEIGSFPVIKHNTESPVELPAGPEAEGRWQREG